MQLNAKIDRQHWESLWELEPRLRLPSRLFVGTRNFQRLLSDYVSPRMRFLEIGCAPGKMLAWVAKVKKVEVAGLDYSTRGIDHTRRIFEHLVISGDLRCEDVFETSFKEGIFDFVFSCGIIEHFNDPKQLIEIHVRLLKPGGKAVITIPNYGRIYGRLQRYFDPDNLALHNLDIMSPSALAALAPERLVSDVRSFPFGRLTGELISFDRVLPKWLTKGVMFCSNVIGLLQPFDIIALCPLIVLEMTRKSG